MPLVVNTIAPENAVPHSKTLFASLLTNDASKQLAMGPGVTAIQG
jgi:hypothetical protein